jgi:hypothetical protein
MRTRGGNYWKLAPKLLPGRQQLLAFTHAAGSPAALGDACCGDLLTGFQAPGKVHLAEKAGAEALGVVVYADLKVQGQ